MEPWGFPGQFTQEGYSHAIIVDENYVLRVPDNLDLDAAAPLLCAGITVWSTITHYCVNASVRWPCLVWEASVTWPSNCWDAILSALHSALIFNAPSFILSFLARI
ncbi:hypothetical protein BC830DRAFT_65340 [Chytriomyces sp. MP71]|nr:hypothetical protein BC830DRAFT_65340 [Chytriomyces sp. MP71]